MEPRREERLDEGVRLELLRAMGIEIWRRRAGAADDSRAADAPAEEAAPVGAASAGNGSAANAEEPARGPSSVGAASAANASSENAEEPVGAASAGGASAANASAASTAAPAGTHCRLHTQSYGHVRVIGDPDQLSARNRRMIQDLVRALGADPDKAGEPREFVWPPSEGSLFAEGRDAALEAFVQRLTRNDADAVLLCVGDDARDIVAPLELRATVLYTGALQRLQNDLEAKRALWQEIQRTLQA